MVAPTSTSPPLVPPAPATSPAAEAAAAPKQQEVSSTGAPLPLQQAEGLQAMLRAILDQQRQQLDEQLELSQQFEFLARLYPPGESQPAWSAPEKEKTEMPCATAASPGQHATSLTSSSMSAALEQLIREFPELREELLQQDMPATSRTALQGVTPVGQPPAAAPAVGQRAWTDADLLALLETSSIDLSSSSVDGFLLEYDSDESPSISSASSLDHYRRITERAVQEAQQRWSQRQGSDHSRPQVPSSSAAAPSLTPKPTSSVFPPASISFPLLRRSAVPLKPKAPGGPEFTELSSSVTLSQPATSSSLLDTSTASSSISVTNYSSDRPALGTTTEPSSSVPLTWHSSSGDVGLGIVGLTSLSTHPSDWSLLRLMPLPQAIPRQPRPQPAEPDVDLSTTTDSSVSLGLAPDQSTASSSLSTTSAPSLSNPAPQIPSLLSGGDLDSTTTSGGSAVGLASGAPLAQPTGTAWPTRSTGSSPWGPSGMQLDTADVRPAPFLSGASSSVSSCPAPALCAPAAPPLPASYGHAGGSFVSETDFDISTTTAASVATGSTRLATTLGDATPPAAAATALFCSSLRIPSAVPVPPPPQGSRTPLAVPSRSPSSISSPTSTTSSSPLSSENTGGPLILCPPVFQIVVVGPAATQPAPQPEAKLRPMNAATLDGNDHGLQPPVSIPVTPSTAGIAAAAATTTANVTLPHPPATSGAVSPPVPDPSVGCAGSSTAKASSSDSSGSAVRVTQGGAAVRGETTAPSAMPLSSASSASSPSSLAADGASTSLSTPSSVAELLRGASSQSTATSTSSLVPHSSPSSASIMGISSPSPASHSITSSPGRSQPSGQAGPLHPPESGYSAASSGESSSASLPSFSDPDIAEALRCLLPEDDATSLSCCSDASCCFSPMAGPNSPAGGHAQLHPDLQQARRAAELPSASHGGASAPYCKGDAVASTTSSTPPSNQLHEGTSLRTAAAAASTLSPRSSSSSPASSRLSLRPIHDRVQLSDSATPRSRHPITATIATTTASTSTSASASTSASSLSSMSPVSALSSLLPYIVSRR
eukprot:GGOE01001049.1.p1 GENE.GGOE01001049.1~~GGOE01001049.1.p1  ORF type:complete len:1093 (-),score=191.67 GGOE01001049.1:316-3477(-)